MGVTFLRPEFVDAMPEDLDEGTIYISTRFRTAAHLCACGCKSKIVTPIKPAKWRFTFDGETVSLWPSIGSWQKPCQSHYVVRKSRIVWARKWSEREITVGRRRDQADLRAFYEDDTMPDRGDDSQASSIPGLIRRPMRWLAALFRSGGPGDIR